MKNKISTSLITFSLFLVIPIISIVSSEILLWSINTDFVNELSKMLSENGDVLADNVNIYTVCSGELGQEVKTGFQKFCDEIQPIQNMSYWALMTILLAGATILLITIFAFIACLHPTVLLWCMRLCLLLVTVSSVVLIIAQSVLLLLTVYEAESYYTGYITPKLLALIGLIAFGATIALFKSLFIAFNKKSPVLGIEVNENMQKDLWDIVNRVAKKVGTSAPEHIIVGLGNNYFVTENDIICFSGKIKGRTLFISLSLLSFLTLTELEAILAHELAHFKGSDTIYSVKIAPVFGKISYGLQELNKLDSLLVLPVSSLISFFLYIFELKNADFDRKREYLADDTGAKVSSSVVFANALAKVTFFGRFWNNVEQESYNALQDGKYLTNKNEFFRLYMSPDNFDENKAIEAIMSLGVSHPRDSHPSLQERFAHLHVDITEIRLFMKKGEECANVIIEDLSDIEENLSVMEQQLLNDRINRPTISSESIN